ncbi:MAG: hypothetical protein KDK78_05240, partial [Chlamydiia bacterium]|nr:hypothetical protein [Chlamydiia bacterium]
MTSSLSRSQNDILDFITDHLPEANSLSEEQRRVQLAALECLPEDASDFRYRPHNLQHVEQALELCPNLRELTLWGTLTSPVDLSQVVAKMKQPLLRLRLGNKGITALEWFSDADAKAWGNFLRNQKELQGLYINVAGLSGRLLRRLHSLPSSLQELCLSDIWTRRDHSSSLRAEHLEGILGHFKQLCSLDLSGNRRLRASILDFVVQLKEL